MYANITVAEAELDMLTARERVTAKIAEFETKEREAGDGSVYYIAEFVGMAARELAFAEGVVKAAHLKHSVTEYSGRQELDVDVNLLAAFSRDLAAGADDEWSGRGNDVRRAFHDGFRKVAQDVCWDAQYNIKRRTEAAAQG